jgi:hypothetical protein
LRLRLPAEVKVAESKCQRSKTTGSLRVIMPLVNANEKFNGIFITNKTKEMNKNLGNNNNNNNSNNNVIGSRPRTIIKENKKKLSLQEELLLSAQQQQQLHHTTNNNNINTKNNTSLNDSNLSTLTNNNVVNIANIVKRESDTSTSNSTSFDLNKKIEKLQVSDNLTGSTLICEISNNNNENNHNNISIINKEEETNYSIETYQQNSNRYNQLSCID